MLQNAIRPKVYFEANQMALIGQLLVVKVIIKPQSNQPVKLSLQVATMSDSVRICGMRLVRYGSDFVCGVSEDQITIDDSRLLGNLTLMTVTNIGKYLVP